MRRLLLLLLLAAPAFAERSLHWNAIDVDARLDRDGMLHVRERQEMVFNGDWNGGERSFDTRKQQRVNVQRIVRIEGSKEIPLTRGGLDEVDRWDDAGNDVIRWRSRMPTDPPFANQTLIYRIDYTYSNAVLPRDEPQRYLLNHDFAFPNREGTIARFTLRLRFDPEWKAQPITVTRTDLQPGRSVIVQEELTYSGAGGPAGVERPIGISVVFAAAAFFSLGALFLYWEFLKGERAVGRLEPVRAQFDPAAMELPPEVAGAVWDLGIGPPEVAAVLARMTQEGKLSSRVHDGTLHLELEVPRGKLSGYERELVSKLFYSGGNETDTDSIRAHYSGTGMDPSDVIRPAIEEQLARISPQWKVKQRRYSIATDALLLLVSIGCLAASGLRSEDDGVAAILGFFIGGFLAIFACVTAAYYSDAVTAVDTAMIVPSLVFALACGPFVFTLLLARANGLHAPVLFALAFWTLALLKIVLDLLKITDVREKIAYRKRIAGTRQFFIEQLRQPNPQLRDEWYPYVLAFGLGDHVDRWFRAHAAASQSGATSSSWSSSSSSSSFSSSSSSSSSWTGGGGAFGGAGASGTWAVAAGAIAAGVAAPSSSGSSGGGGGGGGSSSGGGGGGGW